MPVASQAVLIAVITTVHAHSFLPLPSVIYSLICVPDRSDMQVFLLSLQGSPRAGQQLQRRGVASLSQGQALAVCSKRAIFQRPCNRILPNFFDPLTNSLISALCMYTGTVVQAHRLLVMLHQG